MMLQSAFMMTAQPSGLFGDTSANGALDFPLPLVEKYRPRRLSDFAGLEVARTMLTKFGQNPYNAAWLFIGEPGTGKTTMGLAFAEEIGCEVKHMPSRACDLESVKEMVRKCWFVPARGKFHVVLVDEADQMSHAAQLAFLSILDATGWPPQTIFIFTANATNNLQPRFLSRCRQLRFYGNALSPDAQALLQRIYQGEGGPGEPDYAAILRMANGNIREAVTTIEMELLCPGQFAATYQTTPEPTAAEPTVQPVIVAKPAATGHTPKYQLPAMSTTQVFTITCTCTPKKPERRLVVKPGGTGATMRLEIFNASEFRNLESSGEVECKSCRKETIQ